MLPFMTMRGQEDFLLLHQCFSEDSEGCGAEYCRRVKSLMTITHCSLKWSHEDLSLQQTWFSTLTCRTVSSDLCRNVTLKYPFFSYMFFTHTSYFPYIDKTNKKKDEMK